MKRILILIAVLSMLLSLPAEDMIYKVLDNGLEVIVKKNTTNNSAAVYGFVKTGSKSEEQFLGAGISHYLEHLVSSGTTSLRTEEEYIKLCEELSLTSNAYTTTDMTAYHLIGEEAYTDTMIAVIGEYLQFCVFAQEEVDREREVILKEMILRSTDTYNVVHEWENAQQYPVTNYKYPVIGYPELYKTLTRDDLVTYYNRHYIPNNTIFVAVGNFEPESVLAQVEKVFSGWQRGFYPPVYDPQQGTYGGEFTCSKEFPLNNARVTLNYIIPQDLYALMPELSAALDILCSKRTSALNYRLVEEEKLVNYIYGYASSVPNMRRDNYAAIVFEPRNPEDIDRIIEVIDEELELAAEKGFTDNDLENFLNREKAARILRELPPDREANSLAWSNYFFGQPDMQQIEINSLENICREDMPVAISKALLPKLRMITKALPYSDKETETDKEITQSSYDLMMEKIEISKNTSLLYRSESHKEVVYFNLHLPIYEDWETKENAGIMEMTADLLLKGSKKYDTMVISEWLEDHVIDYNCSVSYDGMQISVKCLTADLEETLNIIIDGFNHPVFAENEIELWKNRKMASLQRYSTTAGYQHRIFRNGVLYPNTRHGMMDSDVVELQTSYSRQDIKKTWEQYFKIDGNVILTINGDITRSNAIETAEDFIKELRHGKINAERNIFLVPDQNRWFSQEYDFEQVNLNINLPAPKTDDDDFRVMMVISTLLNRMDGGLHEATRGVNDLAYYASANYSCNVDWGYLRITSQTSINKRDQLIEVLQQELDKFKTIEIEKSEIEQALINRKIMRQNFLTAPYIGRVSMQNEISGKGYDWFDKEVEVLSSVSAEDIRRVAEKYFSRKTVIVSYPSEDFKRTIE